VIALGESSSSTTGFQKFRATMSSRALPRKGGRAPPGGEVAGESRPPRGSLESSGILHAQQLGELPGQARRGALRVPADASPGRSRAAAGVPESPLELENPIMETIRFEVAEGIGRLVLNRPERMNAITNRMLIELTELLDEVSQRRDVALVVLTGEGRGFCPGADLKHYAAGDSDDVASAEHFRIPVLLHEMPQVTIAAINGPCAGAGLGWACACDLRYASRSATFSSAFLKVASAGDMIGPWTLPRLVGAAKARELYFLPEKFFAEDALRMGLVNGVFDDDELGGEVAGIARRLADAPPHALRTMKRNFLDAERMDIATYSRVETERHLRVMAHEDAREAFRAFVERRPPDFRRR